MATLEKIRSKSILLLIIVGLALLAFIVGDFVNSGSSFFNQKKMVVADIDGEEIRIEEFLAAIEQMTTVYEFETGNQSLTEEMTEQVRQSVWETMIRERVLKTEALNVGLVITKDELYDNILGENIHPVILQRQLFVDPQTGQFDRNSLAQFLSYIDDPNANVSEDMKAYWRFLESVIKNSLLEEKYNVLLSKMLVANDLEVELATNLNAGKVDVLYAVEPYYVIPDSLVSVSNKEIESRYQATKEQYKKNSATCTISYVSFDIKPLDADYVELESWIKNLVPEFTTTTDIAGIVNSNSDKRYVDVALTKSDVDVEFRDSAFNGKVGDIFGPIFINNVYKVARLVEAGIQSPDSVKLRHIFVAEDTKERTQTLADSLVNVINAGGNFADLAKVYSRVPQTAEQGGEIGWVREVVVDSEIAQKAFNTPAGKIFTVESANGVQIFKVDEISARVPKVKLAVVERELIPSSRSQAQIYNDAKQFVAGCKTKADFEKKAQEQGVEILPVYASINDYRIGNIKNSRQVVRWAFEQKDGAVSDVFECDDKFIVATISNLNKDEYKSLSSVSDDIKYELLKEKKADYVVEKMKGKTLASLMGEGLRVDTLKNITFDTKQLARVGNEPKLFALAALGFDANPVKGENGVYVFKKLQRTNVEAPLSAEEEKQMLESQLAYATQYLAMEILKEKSNIKDKRYIAY